jgi:glucose-6-phosphate-specific signal transduction histidine kinase
VRALNKDPLAWGRYVAVAGAYAACYEVTRNFSFSHWMLPAGLRLACLLLVPRRFWPALAVGEALPIAEMAALHASIFGVVWALLASIPPILVCMPVVAWIQGRATLLRADGKINMTMVMAATLACSLAVAIDNSLVLATIVMGDGSVASPVTPQLFLAWVLGCYLGAVALTPTIIALRERMMATGGGSIEWRAVLHSSLTRDAVLIVMPCLGVLMAIASRVDGAALQVSRMAMAVPVIALTLRHGWHGSAIAGLLAGVCLAATAFELLDPSMIRAQAVLAFTISTSLLFGVRVARRLAASHAAPMPCIHTGRH